jgi:hypothetical protein
MKPRPIILRGPYPTVEDTARLLGVSDRRVKELLRLVRSNESLKVKKNRAALEEAGSKVSRAKGNTRTEKRIASASRKRRARGKTAKAHA